ncbi:TIM44-like domain-containing protein [Aureimonas sp. SK2]|uniref:Tim44 domain-containing protein n=1 Tax=Aureimonas sp. SK2 TaxID=3015992 RepID=UPI002443C652|nr:TIM44-like domain-containing protein [Aureimonas sp. SK2]
MGTSAKTRGLALMSVLALTFSLAAVDYAEARRGGSFGSRGARTYQSAPPTNTAPAAAPVQRSMTSPSTAAPAAGAAAAARPGARSGLFGGGFGGALMRGLLIGGLFGLLMGTGFGGLAGMLGLLVQGLLIGLLVWFVIRMFRRRSEGQTAMAGGRPNEGGNRTMYEGLGQRGPQAGQAASARGYTGPQAAAAPTAAGVDQLRITAADLDIFENRLQTLQDAFSREDYAKLREITTPEVASYLSEELATNASKGIRVEARDVTLLQGDVAESWKEGSREYATVAMRYSMVETVRDRETGEIKEGGTAPVESTEVWTFLRDFKDEWKLSAIQEA